MIAAGLAALWAIAATVPAGPETWMRSGGDYVERRPDESARCGTAEPGVYRIRFDYADMRLTIAEGETARRFGVVAAYPAGERGFVIEVAGVFPGDADGSGVFAFSIEPDGDLRFERGAFDGGEGAVFADAGVRPGGEAIYAMGFCPDAP